MILIKEREREIYGEREREMKLKGERKKTKGESGRVFSLYPPISFSLRNNKKDGELGEIVEMVKGERLIDFCRVVRSRTCQLNSVGS